MSHAAYFGLLRIYADIWCRTHCRVVLAGEEHLADVVRRPRVYVVAHPTTWDLPLLAHLSRRNFYVVVADGPFASPLVRWLFRGAGFLKLGPENSEEVIGEAVRRTAAGTPLIYSLKGYGVDFGEDVRPRTGCIRIADAAGADIYPVHQMIEPGKMFFRYYKDRAGKSYPYTMFRDTLYFNTFLPPLRHADWSRPGMGYEDYRRIAYAIEDSFVKTRGEIEGDMAVRPDHYRRMPRWGGSPRRPIV